MKSYCARDKKRYTQEQVSVSHCQGCLIRSCRVVFNNQIEEEKDPIELLYKNIVGLSTTKWLKNE